MIVDKVLITAQFSGMVASDRMKVIRSTGLGESICRKVHDPEILGVFEQDFFVVRLTEICVVFFLAYPVLVAEIALIYRPHIGYYKNAKYRSEHSEFKLLEGEEQHQSGREGDEGGGTPCVANQHRSALSPKGIHEPLRHSSQGPGVVRTRETEERTSKQRYQEADTSCHGGGNQQRFAKFRLLYSSLSKLFQRQEAQQRHRHLRDHQYR